MSKVIMTLVLLSASLSSLAAPSLNSVLAECNLTPTSDTAESLDSNANNTLSPQCLADLQQTVNALITANCTQPAPGNADICQALNSAMQNHMTPQQMAIALQLYLAANPGKLTASQNQMVQKAISGILQSS